MKRGFEKVPGWNPGKKFLGGFPRRRRGEKIPGWMSAPKARRKNSWVDVRAEGSGQIQCGGDMGALLISTTMFKELSFH